MILAAQTSTRSRPPTTLEHELHYPQRPVRQPVRASIGSRLDADTAAALCRLVQQWRQDGEVVHLLAPAALAGDRMTLDRLRLLAQCGAQVRCSPCPTAGIVVCDEEIFLPGGSGEPVRNRALADALTAAYTALWHGAMELPVAARIWGQDPDAARVLRQLGEGRTDETAARVLGLSVRTYRRHIAALMNRLRAASRFQAGAVAAQAGLLSHMPE